MGVKTSFESGQHKFRKLELKVVLNMALARNRQGKPLEGLLHSETTFLTHTLTHTGTARGGHGSSERTTTSGFFLKKGKKPYSRNAKYRFQQLITRRS